MPRKTKEEAEKTRARILASALSLFVKKGYEHTTFTDIAARLGMTKGAVYWHFESKEKLLVALVDHMVKVFVRQIAALEESRAPGGKEVSLSFPMVADLMVRNAGMMVSSPKMSAFFMLMKCQVKWTETSMSRVREELLTNERFGPKQAFSKAIENDIAAGRARAGVDPEQVASVCIAMWDGLVQARLDKFLQCDLEDTLRKSYAAVWRAIAAPEPPSAG